MKEKWLKRRILSFLIAICLILSDLTPFGPLTMTTYAEEPNNSNSDGQQAQTANTMKITLLVSAPGVKATPTAGGYVTEESAGTGYTKYTAVPSPGYKFLKFSFNYGTSYEESTDNPIILPNNGNVSNLTAVFAIIHTDRNNRSIQILVGDGKGSVTFDGDDSVPDDGADPVTNDGGDSATNDGDDCRNYKIVFQPEEGYVFKSIDLPNGVEFNEETSTLTVWNKIISPKEDFTITVNFDKDDLYPIRVGDTQASKYKTSGEGWSYNHSTHTLTLSSYDGDDEGLATGSSIIDYKADTSEALTIKLVGENAIQSSAKGITSNQNVTFTGEGQLDIKSAQACIDVQNRSLTFQSGTVSAESETSNAISAGGIFIEDGVTSVVALSNGTESAIQGTVFNGLRGTAWTNSDRTEGQKSIPVNTTEGNALSGSEYKYVQFPGVHEHSFTYQAKGDTIIATCTEDGECGLTDRQITLQIKKPEHSTSSDTSSAEATLEGLDAFKAATGLVDSDIVISYYRGFVKQDAAPTLVGTYSARLTVNVKGQTQTASVTYTITPDYTAPVGKENLEYEGVEQELVSPGAVSDDYIILYGFKGDEDSQLTEELPKAKDAGEYTVIYKVMPKSDYSYQAETNEISVEIKKVDLTVTAQDASKKYGETDPELTATVVGLKSGDQLDYTLSRVQGEEVGAYEISVDIPTDLKNYNATINKGTFTIQKAELTVSAPVARSLTYNGEEQELIQKGNAVSGKLLYALGWYEPTAESAWSEDVPKGKDAGTYYVWYKAKATDDRYKDSGTQRVAITIERASVTVTVDPKNKFYGEADPKLTATVSGLKGTDSAESIAYSLSRKSGEDAGEYDIYARGAAEQGKNYRVTYYSGQLTIAPAPVTVTADPQKKIYGEADPTFTWKAEGLKNGQEQSVLNTANIKVVRENTGEDAGTYVISVTGPAVQGNYAVTYVPSNLTIEKREVTISGMKAKDKAYDGGVGATYDGDDVVISNVLPADEAGVKVSATAAFADANVGEDKPVTITAELTGTKAGNYAISAESQSTTTATITPAEITIEAVGSEKKYGETDPEFTYNVYGLPAGVSKEDVLEGSLAREVGEAIGTYTILIGTLKLKEGNENYCISDSSYKSAEFEILAGDIDPVVTVQGWTYGGYDPEENMPRVVTGNPGEGEATYYYSTNEGTTDGEEWDGNTIKALDAGTYYVYAKVAATGLYGSATSKPSKFSVAPKQVSVTWSNQSLTYNGENQKPTAVLEGRVDGDDVDVSVGGVHKDAGVYTATAILGGDDMGNYVLWENVTTTYTIYRQAATVTADAKTKIYGEADPKLTAEVTGAVEGENIAYELKRTEGENVGSYIIYVVPGENPNYDVSTVNANLTISQKAATITADAKEKTYGAAEPALTAVVTGTVNGEDLNYILSRKLGEDAGEYDITVTAGYNPNYAVTVTGAKFTIKKKAATVKADAKTKTYGEADPEMTAKVEGTVGADTLNYTLARTAGANVGEYDITVTLGDNPNYEVTVTNAKLTINKKAATITADAKTKTYGEADPELTAKVEGAVGTDELNYTLARTAGANVGEYDITVTLGENSNYDVTATNAKLTINKKAAAITADAKTRTYGEADPELTVVVEGTVGEEKLNYDLARTAGEDAGEYDITVTPGTNSNYDVTVTNAKLTINKKAATITADAKTKTYGEADPELTAVVEGTVGEEKLNYTLSRIAGENVGEYEITVNLLANPNYDVTVTNAKLTINKKAASITADAKEKTYGAAEPALTAKVVGTVDGDDIKYSLTRTVGENAGEYDITVNVGSNPNFDLTVADAKFTIHKREASITVDAKTKTYGEADPELTAKVLGAVNGDVIKYSLTRTAGENAGEYDITVDEGSNPNYDVAITNAKLTINKKAATVTADAKVKIYGEADPELTAKVEGTVGEEKLNYQLARTEGQNVGVYDITVTLGENPNYDVTSNNSTFSIGIKTMEGAEVTLSDTQFTYDGSDKGVQVKSVKLPDGDVISPDNYEVSGTTDAKDVGNYKVIVSGKGNYVGEASAEWSIIAIPVVIKQLPVAKTGLIYNGTEQTLVTPGEAEGGTFVYALGNETSATSEYSPVVSVGKAPAEYVVYYKLVPDVGHVGEASGSYKVKIVESAMTPVVIQDETTDELHLVKGEKFPLNEAGWVSSDKSRITINKKNVLTAKKVTNGYVEITNGDRAIKVYVSQPVISKTMELQAGNEAKVYFQYDEENLSVLWYSTAPDVAVVDQDGTVTGIGRGTAIVRAYVRGKAYSCKVTVRENPVVEERTLHMNVGKKKTLNIKGLKVTSWTSDDTSIASTELKKITALTTGETTLRTDVGGKEYIVHLFVEDPTLVSDQIQATKKANKYTLTLKVGETADIDYKYMEQFVVFKSSNPEVAYESGDGTIVATRAGKANLTAKINGKTVSIAVTVQ